MLELNIWTIVFQIVNFLLLATVLYFVLFKPMMRQIKAREAEREEQKRQIAQDQQEAERLRAVLEVRLAAVEDEASRLVAQAREDAAVEQAQLMQEAQAEAERILAEAHTEAHRLRRQAANEFQAEMLDTILAISGQVIGRAAPPETHDTLIQQLSNRIWEMGRSEMQQVETFRRSLGEREPTAHVTTAHPLTAEQQGLLARTFTALADRHVNLEIASDPALAAGIRVRLGDLVVDSSIADRLSELREAAASALAERLTQEEPHA